MTADAAASTQDEFKLNAASSPVSTRREIDTAPLMALAAVLIVNSHLEEFYPRSFLAADGLLGNSLFFFLSGFGVQLSEAKNHRRFLPYFRRRIIRLYPALILCQLIFVLIAGNAWPSPSPLAWIELYIWPTSYTYIRDIVPFYAIFYFVARTRSIRTYALTALVTLAIYLFCYIPDAMMIPRDAHLSMGMRHGYMHDTAYFEVMLLGGMFALITSAGRKIVHTKPVGVYLLTAAVVLFYFVLKFVMVVEAHFARYYGLLQLLMLAACGGMFISLTSDPVLRLYRSIPPLRWLIQFVAGLTLEIYLVHTELLHYQWLVHIRFPFNLLALACMTLAASYVLSILVIPIQKALAERSST